MKLRSSRFYLAASFLLLTAIAAAFTISESASAELLSLIGSRPLVTRTWDGGGATNNWSEDANWTGDVAPGAADAVVFDGTSTKNAVVDVDFSISSLQVIGGYTGTISQGNSNIIIESIYEQLSGTFLGGSGVLRFGSTFTLNGGSFTAPTGTLNFPSTVTISAVATFDANGGTIAFTGPGFQNLLIPPSLTAHNVIVNKPGNTSLQFANSPSILISNGTLSLIDGLVALNSSGTFEARGDLSIAQTFDGGTPGQPANMVISGPATRTVTFPAGGARMIPLTVNAPNVTLNVSGAGTYSFNTLNLQSCASFGNDLTVVMFEGNVMTADGCGFTQGSGSFSFEGSYTQNGGTFTSGTGTLDFKAPFALNGGTFVASAGSMSFFGEFLILPGTTFNPNGGTVNFTGTSPQQFLRIPTTFTLNNVTVNRAHNTELFFFNSPTTLVVAGSLALIDGRLERNSTGTMEARGDISIASTFDGGVTGNPAFFSIAGAANQTYTNSGGVNPGATWTINKSGGTLTAASSLILQTGQTLNITSGTLYLNGNSDLTAGAINIGTGGRLVSDSATTITLGGNLSNSGTVDLNGGGASCPGTDSILIRSSSATQRAWTGGRNRLIDVDVQNMGGTGTKTVFSGTNSGGNSATWVFDNNCPPQLTVTPSVVDVPAGANQLFTGGGGFPPYTFSLAVNNSGGTIGAATGTYTAGSIIGASDTVRVTDAFGGTADAAVTVVGVGTRLGFIVQPSDAASFQIIAPPIQVAVQDSSGNTITNSTAAVTISIQNNPGSGALTGTLTRNAVSGIATFDDVAMNGSGAGYTLRATSPGLTTGISSAFSIGAGNATQIGFVVQPSNTAPGADISPAVQVAIQDASGNTVTSANLPVTIALGANPGSGVLSGSLMRFAVGGIATFPNLSINNLGTGYTLVATSGSLTGDTSAAFNVADPLIVTNTSDSGLGSLRQAINFANSTVGADTIRFNISGAAPFVIDVPTDLPAVGGSVTIDGASQPGYAGAPIVEVRGSSSAINGFRINGDSCTIQGLAITGFGIAPAFGAGIFVLGDDASLIDNYVGLEVDGATARANEIGILVADSASNTFVGPNGGQSANLRNIVSGNVYSIIVSGTNSFVEDNYVGTNAAGTSAVPNTYGVIIFGNGNTVRDNVISGNTNFGIGFLNFYLQNALAERNRIGLAAATPATIPNGGSGVLIPYEPIRGVRLSQNQIFGNNDLGIRLGSFNPGSPAVPNDPRDSDTGANGLQNYPDLTTAFQSNGVTRILGSLNSTPSSTFRLEFFSSPSCDPSGNGEGETFVGAVDVVTDATGYVNFISQPVNLPLLIPNGRFITAIATDAAGNTSEFSRCQVVSQRSQILGTVISNGVPVSNVQVRLTNPQGPTFTRTTASNSSGNFSFSFLPPADYTLTVIHPNLTFSPSTRFYPNLSTDQNNQNFVAGTPQRFTLRGRARTSASGTTIAVGKAGSSALPPVPAGGFPLLGVTFNITGPGINRNVTNDSFGTYRFDALPPGSYVLTPTKPNYVFNPPLANVNIGSNETVDFDGTSLGLSTLSGRIVYDSALGIQAMNADGSGVVTILPNLSRIASRIMPRFSENGQRVVFVNRSTTNSENRIITIGADGTAREFLLTENARVFSPVHSPDGNRIAFHNNSESLVVMNVDGSNAQTIIGNCMEPDWSPDSTQIVCVEEVTSTSDRVKTVNVATGAQTTLDGTSGRKFSPRWSPDGTRIAFIRRQSGTPSTHSIVVRTILGGSDSFMSGTNNLNQTLSWSPDSARLLFIRDAVAAVGNALPPGGNNQLVTIQSSDGQNMLVIVDRFDGNRVDWGTSNSFVTPASTTPTVIDSGAVSISFPSTTGANGVTTITPIEPGSAGAAPNGFVIGNFAFEINTTAGFTPPVTICVDLDDQGVLSRHFRAPAQPALMHNENGVLVNITTSYDQQTDILCGQANSFSPFVVAEQVDSALPTISGLVVDSNGDPMGGVLVNLTGAENDQTRTDSDGLFQFVNLVDAGNYNVQPQNVGYLFSEYSQDFLAVAGENTVVFTGAASSQQISGRVADPLGVGVAGITVTLDGSSTDEAVTDANGNYFFTGLPVDGTYFVAPSGGSLTFVPAELTVSPLTGDVSGMDFTALAPTAASVSVGGRVLTSEGFGIGNVRVTMLGADGNTRIALTNGFGYYRFDDIEVGGVYLISVEAKRHQFENPTRTVNVLDELTDVNFSALPESVPVARASDLFSFLSRYPASRR